MKYIKYVRTRFSKPDFLVFKVSDLKLALKSQGIKKPYLYLMLHNLLKKNEVKRITKGIYTFHDDVCVAGFAFSPFYYGMENAFNIRGISGQGANFTIMTIRNVRQGLRTFDKRNYIIKQIDKKYFFGYDLIRYGIFWIPVSNIEKALIDIIYFNKSIRPDLLLDVIPILDYSKLKEYLKKYNLNFRKKVLGLVSNKLLKKVYKHKKTN